MNKTIVNKINYFILTGGPGSGKTSVLNELACRGFLTVPEVAREIIQTQHTKGGKALHTGDRIAFRDLMLEHSITGYEKMQEEEHAIFFDRGIVDLYGYSKAFCGELSLDVVNATAKYRYNQTVFIFPPWREIYVQNKERKQGFEEAIFTYNVLKKAYSDCDYYVVEMPKISIRKRIDFILKTIIKNGLTNLKNDINQLLGFHEDTPKINYGSCGVFAKLFFDAWNTRFKNKVHIVFVMVRSHEECWHIAIRLPTGELYDGGVGIHTDEAYGNDYTIEDMFLYDHELLEKWSYGLERDYPRFCPDFNKEAIDALIQSHLNCLTSRDERANDKN